MSETVSLKRPRSTSNANEEPEEKYNSQTNPQPILVNSSSLGAMSDRVATTASFPLLQYYHMINQMQSQQADFPVMMRKEREESGTSSRRQTISTPSTTPRPIRVPPQPFLNPLQFFPTVPQLAQQQQPEVPAKSPSPTRSHSPYHVPSFQRADEEVFSKFVESVRKLAAKLTAERS